MADEEGDLPRVVGLREDQRTQGSGGEPRVAALVDIGQPLPRGGPGGQVGDGRRAGQRAGEVDVGSLNGDVAELRAVVDDGGVGARVGAVGVQHGAREPAHVVALGGDQAARQQRGAHGEVAADADRRVERDAAIDGRAEVVAVDVEVVARHSHLHDARRGQQHADAPDIQAGARERHGGEARAHARARGEHAQLHGVPGVGVRVDLPADVRRAGSVNRHAGVLTLADGEMWCRLRRGGHEADDQRREDDDSPCPHGRTVSASAPLATGAGTARGEPANAGLDRGYHLAPRVPIV